MNIFKHVMHWFQWTQMAAIIKGHSRSLDGVHKWNSCTHILGSFKIRNSVNQRCMEHKWKACQSKLSSFFLWKKDRKVMEIWWKKFRDVYWHQISQNQLFQTAKSGFDPAWVCFQVFLNFYSGKRAGFIQTLENHRRKKVSSQITPKQCCRPREESSGESLREVAESSFLCIVYIIHKLSKRNKENWWALRSS